jgi:hypothetical protein
MFGAEMAARPDNSSNSAMPVRIIPAILLALAAAGLAQRARTLSSATPGREYIFVRLEYTDLPQHHRRFGWASEAAAARDGG